MSRCLRRNLLKKPKQSSGQQDKHDRNNDRYDDENNKENLYFISSKEEKCNKEINVWTKALRDFSIQFYNVKALIKYCKC